MVVLDPKSCDYPCLMAINATTNLLGSRVTSLQWWLAVVWARAIRAEGPRSHFLKCGVRYVAPMVLAWILVGAGVLGQLKAADIPVDQGGQTTTATGKAATIEQPPDSNTADAALPQARKWGSEPIGSQIGYALGYELGRRLLQAQVDLPPDKIAQAIAEANNFDLVTHADSVDSSPVWRLGRRIAALRPMVRPWAVASGMQDVMTDAASQMDQGRRIELLRQLRMTKPSSKARFKQMRRAGYGWQNAPDVPSQAGATVPPMATMRTSVDGRVDARMVDQYRVQNAVGATDRNTKEVDAYEPVAPQQ